MAPSLLQAVPEGLFVEVDDGGVHILIGPPRRPLLTRNEVGQLLAGASGVGALLAVDGSALALFGVAATGSVVMAATRLWRFFAHESSMRLTCNERGLVLVRRHQQRVFRREVLPMAAVDRMEVVPDGLVLHQRDGRAREIRTYFRTEDHLEWIAALVNQAVARQSAFAEEEAGRDRRGVEALLSRSG